MRKTLAITTLALALTVLPACHWTPERDALTVMSHVNDAVFMLNAYNSKCADPNKPINVIPVKACAEAQIALTQYVADLKEADAAVQRKGHSEFQLKQLANDRKAAVKAVEQTGVKLP